MVFAGAKPWAELPPYFAAGDVFCMPTRTRKAGLEVEGLGIVYLEASATGLPVVAGDSGGAPDAVLDGETGYRRRRDVSVRRRGAGGSATHRRRTRVAAGETRSELGGGAMDVAGGR